MEVNEPPEDWDFDTILYAKFNDSTAAGNVDWVLDEVSHLVIKTRPQGEFTWQTICVREVHSLEDFEIVHNDYFVPSGQPTDYAIVPVLYGSEGNYAMTSITPTFDKMFLIGKDQVYGTVVTDGFCDTTRKHTSNAVELLNQKYPIFVRNTIADYDTGECKGCFVPIDGCDLMFEQEDDFYRISYEKEVMDFIADSKVKCLKLPDGRIWIIQVTADPTSTANNIYNYREIQFPWVEVGNRTTETLYYLGLSEITSEWW